jgi:ABC-type nitrate/sulfonate/bicarbonate transport system permease component
MSGAGSDSYETGRRIPRWVVPVVTTLAAVVLWELIIRAGLVLERAFPTPTAIGEELYRQVQTGEYWGAVGNTMKAWALGLGFAIAFAIPIGILVGTVPWIYRSLRFLIDFIRPIPAIAALPLFIIIFGITLKLEMYVAGFAAFWPLFFQTLYGVQDIDPVAKDTARAYGLNGFMRFTFVSIPGAAPYIATGLRISATYALLVCIGTELIVALPGIGQHIFKAQYAGQPALMWAYIVTSGLLGLIITFGFNRLERVTLHWHPSQRGEAAS